MLTPKDAQHMHERCTHTFDDGRRCASLRGSHHPELCPYHANLEAQDTYNRHFGKLLITEDEPLDNARAINGFLTRVALHAASARITPRHAASMGYLGQLLLMSLTHIRKEDELYANSDEGLAAQEYAGVDEAFLENLRQKIAAMPDKPDPRIHRPAAWGPDYRRPATTSDPVVTPSSIAPAAPAASSPSATAVLVPPSFAAVSPAAQSAQDPPEPLSSAAVSPAPLLDSRPAAHAPSTDASRRSLNAFLEPSSTAVSPGATAVAPTSFAPASPAASSQSANAVLASPSFAAVSPAASSPSANAVLVPLSFAAGPPAAALTSSEDRAPAHPFDPAAPLANEPSSFASAASADAPAPAKNAGAPSPVSAANTQIADQAACCTSLPQPSHFELRPLDIGLIKNLCIQLGVPPPQKPARGPVHRRTPHHARTYSLPREREKGANR